MNSVLIVDDEKHIRQFVAANLKARGYSVSQAETAEEGLQKLKAEPQQALVLDIKLPGMSGWNMLKEIASDPDQVKVPVVVMTASSVINQPDEYPYPNIVARLTKPVSLKDLLYAVNCAIR